MKKNRSPFLNWYLNNFLSTFGRCWSSLLSSPLSGVFTNNESSKLLPLGETTKYSLMEILINRRYEISLDGELSYFFSYKSFSLLAKITLLNYRSKEPRLVLKEVFTPFRTSFDIIRDGDIFKFRLEKAWKTQYNCKVGTDLYEIYSHKGRKYSIFKNNIQVAWWDSNIILLFGNKNRIIADEDADYELLISFCLILEDPSSGSTIDVGNIGGQGKIFDEHWQPK